jgi:hypothetical protein
MPISTQYDLQGLMPVYAPQLAVTQVVNLPFGGPTGTGGPFLQGTLLGATTTATANEVATLTIGGSPTGGTFTVTFVGDKPYITSALAYNVSLANFRTALETAVPEWKGNITVTGTAGSSYVVTFGTDLANQRIGGLFQVNISALTGGTPTGSWARTTRGSCGAAQYDVYSSGSNNDVDAFLQYDTLVSPGGSRLGEFNGSTNQPYAPSAFVAGFFDPADLVGLDSNAYTLGKLVKKAGGTYVHLI